jgi:hypothetical protein
MTTTHERINDEQFAREDVEADLHLLQEQALTVEVPTVEHLLAAKQTLDKVHEIAPGEFVDESGRTLDADLVTDSQEANDPENWILTHDEKARYAHIAGTRNVQHLSETEQSIFSGYSAARAEERADAGLAPETELGAFTSFKSYAGNRMGLSNQLKILKEAAATETIPQADMVPRSEQHAAFTLKPKVRSELTIDIDGNEVGAQSDEKAADMVVLEQLNNEPVAPQGESLHKKPRNGRPKSRRTGYQRPTNDEPVSQNSTGESQETALTESDFVEAELLDDEAKTEASSTPLEIVDQVKATDWSEVTLQDVGPRARLRTSWNRAKANLQLAMSSAGNQVAGKEHRKRTLIIGGAMGALAISAMVLESRGYHMGTHSSGAANASGNLPVGGGHAKEAHAVLGSHRHAHSVLKQHSPVHDVAHSVKLNQGDTIWHEAELQLNHSGSHATGAQIQAETQRILDLNHMSWDDASHLSEGTVIKL